MEQITRLVKSVDACALRLDELNKRFPNLATDTSRTGVEYWYKRKIQAPVHEHAESDPEPNHASRVLQETALRLLKTHGLEEVLDILLNDHRIDINLSQLIHLVGNQAYLVALRRDAQELLRNAVSYQQIAGLWNDQDRPALGGPRWDARSVSMLVE